MTEAAEFWVFGDIEQRKVHAHQLLSLVFSIIGLPSSMLDVGGGAGSWCAAAKKLGVSRVLLVDACPPNQVVPELTKHEQVKANLETGIPIEGQFDLISCIEVAEHLTDSAADKVVQQMTRFGNFILFSAAIPGQGGYGHINERLHDHWHDKFSAQNFVKYDIIRPMIISEARIPYYYRQNLFLYVKKGFDDNLKSIPEICNDIELINTDHLKSLYSRDSIDLRTALGALPNALKRSLKRRLGQ